MTLTELRYLVALDRERHFGHAAEACFVSQPTLSVALRKLEDSLGVPIFERQRGEVRPTPVGERIIDQARRVLSEAALIENIAAQGQDELTGRLRFGAIYTVGPYLLPHLVPTLSRRNPGMPLVIEENFTAELARQLKRNEIDVIAVAEPFAPPGVRTWALYDEPFVIVVPQQHPWASEPAIPAARLADENLLLLGAGHCFREQVIAACPGCAQVADEHQPLTGSSLETIRHMVASGLGVTVLPKSSVDNRLEQDSMLVTLPFSGSAPTRRVVLAWRRSFPRPQAVAELRTAILESGLAGVRLLHETQAGD